MIGFQGLLSCSFSISNMAHILSVNHSSLLLRGVTRSDAERRHSATMAQKSVKLTAQQKFKSKHILKPNSSS